MTLTWQDIGILVVLAALAVKAIERALNRVTAKVDVVIEFLDRR